MKLMHRLFPVSKATTLTSLVQPAKSIAPALGTSDSQANIQQLKITLPAQGTSQIVNKLCFLCSNTLLDNRIAHRNVKMFTYPVCCLKWEIYVHVYALYFEMLKK